MTTEKTSNKVLPTNRLVNGIILPKGTLYSSKTERLMGGWGSGGSRLTTITYENGMTEQIFHRGPFSFDEN